MNKEFLNWFEQQKCYPVMKGLMLVCNDDEEKCMLDVQNVIDTINNKWPKKHKFDELIRAHNIRKHIRKHASGIY